MASVTRLNRAAWRDRLQMTSQGAVKGNLYNACLAIRHAPEFRGIIAYDAFSLRTHIRAPLPWSDHQDRAWSNFDDAYMTEWLQANDVPVGREIVAQAVEAVAYENRFHPVRDWLDGLTWDGQPRLDDWLTYYVGADRTDYTQAVGKAWPVSAVARVYRPGCKADHVLILEGPQGIRKSTAIKTLAGHAWFTDELADFGSKDAGLQMRGVWIIELAELDHLSRSEASRIKSFISRSTDRFRPPYGARLIEAPRECVFAGTVNQDEYLRDETGGRRFWPVRVNGIDIDALAADREQLWAEAVHLFRQQEPWWITDQAITDLARSAQSERQESDAWEKPVAEWTAGESRFTTSEVLDRALGKRLADITDRDAKRVSKILRGLGFVRITTKIAGKTIKTWRLPEDAGIKG